MVEATTAAPDDIINLNPIHVFIAATLVRRRDVIDDFTVIYLELSENFDFKPG